MMTVRRARRGIAATISALTAVAGIGLLSSPASAAAVTTNGTDASTGGNWSSSLSGSRTYTYGTFGYVLPDSPGTTEYEVGGSLTTQPRLDETGGPGFGDNAYAGEQATYSVHGPVQPDLRTLELPGGSTRRATACFG